MTLQEAIQRAHLVANKKTATLAVTDDKYVTFKALANLLQDDWTHEPDVKWNSRYQQVSLGSVTGNAVDMDDSIYELSDREGDYVTVALPGTNQFSYWSLVTPEESRRFQYNNAVSVINGQLVFPRTFTTESPEYNGEVFIPAYVELDELTNPSDTIQVDDPNWLVYMMAAEYVRNTVTKLNQYPALIQKANNLMIKMKQKNDAQIDTVEMYPTVSGETFLGGGYLGGTFRNSAGQELGD